MSSNSSSQMMPKEIRGKLRSSVVEGRPKPQGWCNHRARPITVVFTEMGCHASCQSCGAVGPGCPTSEEAQRALLLATGKSGNGRYL
jgi:hypothetical protein